MWVPFEFGHQLGVAEKDVKSSFSLTKSLDAWCLRGCLTASWFAATFGSHKDYNLFTQGILNHIQLRNNSFWLCEASVTLPQEGRNVTVDIPCLNQGQGIGSELEVCYKNTDPTQASVSAPYWVIGGGVGRELPGSRVPYQMSCSGETRETLQHAIKMARTFWIILSIFILILLMQFVLCLVCCCYGLAPGTKRISDRDIELERAGL